MVRVWRDAPLFAFSVPEVGLYSGPFQLKANADAVINGSANKAEFLHLFNAIFQYVQKQRTEMGKEL